MIDKILCTLLGMNLFAHAYNDNYNFSFWLTVVALVLTIIIQDEKEKW